MSQTFKLLSEHKIESLNVVVTEYVHEITGARHVHIASPMTENVFLVALRTIPTDSTGVAHILEHTVLCGSERYPVRDPFFLMLRRSLNSFMNAMTSSDWTAYPFATTNKKDYDNLLRVYLDAVFFPNIDPLDFAQEGHRLAFENAEDITSPLALKGVVYNEMKGAMSNPVSYLWQVMTKHLYPATTYHFNSGGDPQCIPTLSHAELMAFYKRHYHPSNATFFTFGDIDACDHQTVFESQVLSRFKESLPALSIPCEQRYDAPIRVQESYAVQEEDTTQKTHIVLGWLLTESTDPFTRLSFHLLSSVLLDNSSSPLLHALETSDLGLSPSPLCGVDDSAREMNFMAGLEGSELIHIEAVEQLILTTLFEVVEKGIAPEQVDAMLHQLELSQREIRGGTPYGMQLIFNAIASSIHHATPTDALNLDPWLEKLREQVKDKNFIPQLIKTHLLDNPHRVTLTLIPDKAFSARATAREAMHLEKLSARLSTQEKENIAATQKALAERQAQEDDVSLLPKVGREDIPASMPVVESKIQSIGNQACDWFAQGTNGLVYQHVVMPLPALDEPAMQLLPTYTDLLTEFGIGKTDYRTTQARHAQTVGGIGAGTSIRTNLNDVNTVQGYFMCSVKALVRNHTQATELLKETLETARFDEFDRMRDMIAQIKASQFQGITSSGHQYAMTTAMRGMNAYTHRIHHWDGLANLQWLRECDEKLKTPEGVKQFATQLQSIHECVTAQAKQFLLIAGERDESALMDAMQTVWKNEKTIPHTASPFSFAPHESNINEAWLVDSAVNFCARAYPTVTLGHEDAPALTLLGGFLRNGFLHSEIREKGGAYGAGASQQADQGAFCFYTYRDPRIEATLKDFDRAIEWMLNEKHTERQLEEALLGVISGLDKPKSPAGEARTSFYNQLHGRTPEQRQAFREGLLAVTLQDLKTVAEKYLRPEGAHTAIVSHAGARADLEKLGLSIVRL